MTDQEIKDLIDFFNNIEVDETLPKENEENKDEGVLKVQVTYKLNPEFFKNFEEFKDFKNFEFTTAELYYLDVSKTPDNVKHTKKELTEFFGSPVYWLDINEHEWPAESKNLDIEGIKNQIINPSSNENEKENFKKFLDKLYDNIIAITKEGTSQFYGNNLVTNNHWHDIVKLIKLFIDKKGDVELHDEEDEEYEEVKPYFKRMVFEWDDKSGKRTSLHPKFGSRSFLDALLNNIKKVSHTMKKEEIKKLLEYKKQVILQGAPGTGKTYIAKEIADEMTKEGGEWKIIQFHPSYTYEDFVRGIVTEVDKEGKISYKVTNKILADFAQNAKDNPQKKFVLIIDEINRANLPSVLGELIYALEYRGEEVESMYNHPEYGQKISLPENLYIIGTMNTTDRSIGHIDYAIRRRFAFYTLSADKSVIEEEYKNNENLKDKALELFDKIKNLTAENISPDYSIDDIMIGHSYFLAEDEKELEEELKMKLEYEIKPILREYYKDGILIDRNNDNKESLIDKINKLSLQNKQNNQEKTQE